MCIAANGPVRAGAKGDRQVAPDGIPPVINRARVYAREMSGRGSANLGGIAEQSLCPRSRGGDGLIFLLVRQESEEVIL